MFVCMYIFFFCNWHDILTLLRCCCCHSFICPVNVGTEQQSLYLLNVWTWSPCIPSIHMAVLLWGLVNIQRQRWDGRVATAAGLKWCGGGRCPEHALWRCVGMVRGGGIEDLCPRTCRRATPLLNYHYWCLLCVWCIFCLSFLPCIPAYWVPGSIYEFSGFYQFLTFHDVFLVLRVVFIVMD